MSEQSKYSAHIITIEICLWKNFSRCPTYTYLYVICKKVVIAVFLDIKSAFSSVPHDAFLKVCDVYGFSNNSLNLVKSIHSNIQKVRDRKQQK